MLAVLNCGRLVGNALFCDERTKRTLRMNHVQSHLLPLNGQFERVSWLPLGTWKVFRGEWRTSFSFSVCCWTAGWLKEWQLFVVLFSRGSLCHQWSQSVCFGLGTLGERTHPKPNTLPFPWENHFASCFSALKIFQYPNNKGRQLTQGYRQSQGCEPTSYSGKIEKKWKIKFFTTLKVFHHYFHWLVQIILFF